MQSSAFFPLYFVVAALGCTGNLATEGMPADGAPIAGGGGTGPSPSACTTADVGPTPLTRLTSWEYENAVRELLGVTADVVALRGADERPGAFVANSQAPLSEPTVESYRQVAEQAAAAAAATLEQALPCVPAVAGVAECARAFIESFGLRSYRRPLSPPEISQYEALFALGNVAGSFVDGVRVVVQGMLQSPHFLYRVEKGLTPALDQAVELSDYELATRLSFLLRRSLPDAQLFEAAASGQLRTPAGLRAQAERLFAAPEAEAAVASFFAQWLHVDDLSGLQKQAELFPDFDEATTAAMQNEMARFANHVVRRGDGLLKTLFTAPVGFPEGPLAKIYGVTVPQGYDAAQPVALDPTQRAGLLTQAGVLAAAAHTDQGSPIFRGIVIRENVLCQPLPSPPADVNAQPPVPDPTATTRQRFAKHVAEPACAGCHSLIDPLGLGFENYDAVGAYRALENNLPVDASGNITGTDVDGPFSGAVELSARLAESDNVRKCMMNQWFRYTLARGETERDACGLQGVYQQFSASGFNVRELVLALVASDAFRLRRAH